MLSPLEQQVIDHINDDELIRWVQELTQIPGVWRPQEGVGEEAAARWVEARCREMGLETFFEWVQPGRPNVIAVWGGGGGKTLMFEGHTDVVTEGDPAAWTDPPFSAVIKNGRIYGRGANDMKAGLVCALIATKAIVQSGVKLAGNILFGAVCDEEGQMIGIKHFVEQGWAKRVDAAIVCEPEENHLCISQKGVMWLRIVIEGVMAHGAMPLTGVNSAYPMARLLTLVHGLEEREISRHGRDEFLGQPSITPTILRSPRAGEPQNNVMPGATEVILDCRLIPGQEPERIVEQVRQMLAAVTAVAERHHLTADDQGIEGHLQQQAERGSDCDLLPGDQQRLGTEHVDHRGGRQQRLHQQCDHQREHHAKPDRDLADTEDRCSCQHRGDTQQWPEKIGQPLTHLRIGELHGGFQPIR